MSTELEQLEQEAEKSINAAADLRKLDEERVRYLGKKGLITERMQALGKLAPEQRKEAGKYINITKQKIQDAIQARKEVLEREALNAKLESERIDVTLPGRGQLSGGLHPVTPTI